MSFAAIIDFLESPQDIAVAIRLVIATLFGSLIGWERVVKDTARELRPLPL